MIAGEAEGDGSQLTLQRVLHPDALPAAWDELASSYFQRRAFLRHAHTYNPCRQRYYLLRDGDTVQAGAVVYSLRMDMLTFLGLPSPVMMHIAGVPCSVSSGGLLGDSRHYPQLLTRLRSAEVGLLLCLNLDACPVTVNMVQGRTLPTIVLNNPFRSWGEYRDALRATYRRRLRSIEAAADSLTITNLPCSTYNADMHGLYEQVYQRSRDKLERLTADFFRHLPAEFHLTVLQSGERLLGWTICLLDDERWYFVLGGRSYAPDILPDLYFVMLLTVLKQGIAAGARQIDFGQTAEIPKMRLGGIPREKYMLGAHSNPLWHTLLRWGGGLLSNRRVTPAAHVFKDGQR